MHIPDLCFVLYHLTLDVAVFVDAISEHVLSWSFWPGARRKCMLLLTKWHTALSINTEVLENH